MKSLILAGGFATRLYPLTINKAKALLEYKGRPLISHIVDKIPFDIDILITTNKKFEDDFKQWMNTVNRNVELCIEESTNNGQKKGAITAVDYWIRTKNIDTDLLVVAGDNYFEFDLQDFVNASNGRNALIAVHDVGERENACDGKPCQVGLAVLEGNRVVQFDEKPERATSSFVSTGIYVLPRRVFPLLSEYCAESKRDNMGSFISHLVYTDRVDAYPFDATWIDIGPELSKEPQYALA
jgi:glucose-1-phosphate thymidylyltransferase